MAKDYWFFMSYAGRDAVIGPDDNDAGDAYLNLFFRDLAKEVAAKAGLDEELKPPDIGFLAPASIPTGWHWPLALIEALQTSRTYICVYSRSYFNSLYCGKEFQFFLDRLKAHAGPGAEPAPLILPLLWEHPDTLPKELPPALSEIQFKHDDFGRAYAENGLSYLKRQSRHKDDYDKFVQKFAAYLVGVAEQYRVPPRDAPPSLKDAKAAFPVSLEEKRQQSARAAGGGGPHPPAGDAGPKVARFIFVAGQGSEYACVKDRVDCYDPDVRGWKPYLPATDEPVGLTTLRVALAERLYYEDAPAGPDLLQRLDEAEEKNIIVILIVDPWSVRIETYRRLMSDYDRRNFVNCGVLIPWNEQDDETQSGGDKLLDAIEKVFSRNLVFDNPYIREPIPSSEELQKKLTAAIHEVRKRIMQRGRVLRKIKSGSARPLPTVEGPQGGAS
jgi:FxsC-like protein